MRLFQRQLLWIWASLGILLFSICWVPSSAASDQCVDVRTKKTATFNELFSAELYGGYLHGRSREFVFDDHGRKVSELFWTIDKAYVVGGSFAARPFERLKISIGGWAPVKSINTMDDYDWTINNFADWSHWSHHPDTTLHRAYMVDARVAFNLLSLQRPADSKGSWIPERVSLDIIGGYRLFNLSWTAYGGSYIYSSEGGLRNQTGQFRSEEPGISYDQWWETPYVGLGGSIGINRLTLSAEVIGSLWAKGRDRDDHHMRTLLFEESFSNVGMIALNIGINYDLTRNLALFARFDYEKFFEGTGETTMTNYATSEVTTFGGNAAGADFYAAIYSMGLTIKF